MTETRNTDERMLHEIVDILSQPTKVDEPGASLSLTCRDVVTHLPFPRLIDIIIRDGRFLLKPQQVRSYGNCTVGSGFKHVCGACRSDLSFQPPPVITDLTALDAMFASMKDDPVSSDILSSPQMWQSMGHIFVLQRYLSNDPDPVA